MVCYNFFIKLINMIKKTLTLFTLLFAVFLIPLTATAVEDDGSTCEVDGKPVACADFMKEVANNAKCELNGQSVDCAAFFNEVPTAVKAGFLGFVGIWILFILAISIFYIVVQWKVYTKAGKKGWAVLIPIYNMVVGLQIVNRPWWWIFLMFIPIVNIVIAIICINDLAKAFGKGTGFTLGLIFLWFVFLPIIAFGNLTYTKPIRPEDGQVASPAATV